MLLGEVKRPFSERAWAFEVKFDGYRTLAQWSKDGTTLKSRRATDMTRWFGEVTAALAAIDGRRCVIDGEICVLNCRRPMSSTSSSSAKRIPSTRQETRTSCSSPSTRSS